LVSQCGATTVLLVVPLSSVDSGAIDKHIQCRSVAVANPEASTRYPFGLAMNSIGNHVLIVTVVGQVQCSHVRFADTK
jgi:hypothetical protein